MRLKLILSVYWTLLSFHAAVTADCPSGWTRYEENCYHFSHDTEPWMLAQMFCLSHNAHIADINDANEDAFLQANVKRLNANHWVGGNDLVVENIWVWADSNEPMSYTNWKTGEPNNLRQNENCMDLRPIPGWNDEECDKSQFYICERPREEPATIVG